VTDSGRIIENKRKSGSTDIRGIWKTAKAPLKKQCADKHLGQSVRQRGIPLYLAITIMPLPWDLKVLPYIRIGPSTMLLLKRTISPLNGATGVQRDGTTKTMSAREVKNGFGLMIDTARAEPVLIEKHGRVVVVVSVEEYERLSVQSGLRIRGKRGPRGRRRVANGALARVTIDQLLKSADRTHADSRRVRFDRPLDGDGKADCALFDRQGCAFGALEAESLSANLTTIEPWGLCDAGQSGCAEWHG
jgi:prevent-host-death family protein